MYCNHCGKPNPDNSRFCNSCGSPISAGSLPAAPAAAQAEWEYKDFVLDYSNTGLGWRLADATLVTSTRVECWAKVRAAVMENLQPWLDQGWQPVASIGPDCLEFKEQQRRELGGGLALFGVNTYIFLQTVRIQMRRPKSQPAPAQQQQQQPGAAPSRPAAELTELVMQDLMGGLDKTWRDRQKRFEETLRKARNGPFHGDALKHACIMFDLARRSCERHNIPPESIPLLREFSVFDELKAIENELTTRWMAAQHQADADLLLRDLTDLAERGLPGLIDAPTGVSKDRWSRILEYPGICRGLEEDYMMGLQTCLIKCGGEVTVWVKMAIRKRLGEEEGNWLIQCAEQNAKG